MGRSKTPQDKPQTKAPAKAAPAKKPAANPKAKSPASKAPAKPKDRVPLRKNRPAAEKSEPKVAIAETMPPATDLIKSLGLTMQEALFVDQYLIHYNGRRAYTDAGYQSASDNAASVAASHLLRKPKIAEYLRIRGKAMIERAELEQDRLMLTLNYTAYGDANELIMNRIDCCRFCYGEGNQYQFTPQEFERYKEDYAAECERLKILGAEVPEFDPKGGIGYNPNREPYHDCPECFGRGRPEVVIADTRYLSPAAQAMYAGVKVGKNGIEVITNSQEKARETLAKIHKLFDDTAKVNVSFDPESLDAIFGEKMGASEAKMQQMLEERRKLREERGDD